MSTEIIITMENNLTVSTTVQDEEKLMPIGSICFDGRYILEEDGAGVSICVNMKYAKTIQYKKGK